MFLLKGLDIGLLGYGKGLLWCRCEPRGGTDPNLKNRDGWEGGRWWNLGGTRSRRTGP